MQGIAEFIPTETKISYINQLIKIGFDTIDVGSFVSPKAIPQMRDTAEVLRGLDLHQANSKLLVIVANVRGALDALDFDEVATLGFPLSLSETFQQRNTNKSIEEAIKVVDRINDLCEQSYRKLVVYLSMGFGNPYGDAYSPELLTEFTEKLQEIGVQRVALADTVGTATPSMVKEVFEMVLPAFPEMEIGAHLHATPQDAYALVKAAYEAGCRRFDSAMGGLGGCPMAKDSLTGNISTETLVEYLMSIDALPEMNMEALAIASERRRILLPSN
ncbi:hydroxymethylglutaryl-CoA lyase [Algivirga pacifica]|uniref:Hydroxymethylglutaryl-CoA lyase n=2 Tax=Algivirga pacifica TaxID=1162670 RepID=A0ABP9DGU7_9BACT